MEVTPNCALSYDSFLPTGEEEGDLEADIRGIFVLEKNVKVLFGIQVLGPKPILITLQKNNSVSREFFFVAQFCVCIKTMDCWRASINKRVSHESLGSRAQ